MRITFFGSSITSAYWNGAATYYRGICRALHRLGHSITFVEQDIYDRQKHRDLEKDPEYAEVVICSDLKELDSELDRSRESDLIVKCSGVGRYDDYLAEAVLEARTAWNRVVYWDVDAPHTLDTAFTEPDNRFRDLVPNYDAILTYGGGPKVLEGYRRLGARIIELIYNALDPDIHHPVPADPAYDCDLLFVGNRLPDREARVRAYFLDTADACPTYRFLLGGEGWGDLPLPSNVRYLGHIPTELHNRLNCSARLVLNVNRQSMANYGFSPPTRIFEAAGAGACIVTDMWEGIENFLLPGKEVLVASSPEDVATYVSTVSPERARDIGRCARERVISEHSYERRGQQLQQLLNRLFSL